MENQQDFSVYTFVQYISYGILVQHTMHGNSCENNIMHSQHSPTCFIYTLWGVGVHDQQSKVIMCIISLHQENSHFSQIFSRILQHSSKFPPSPTTPFLQPYLSQSDIENEYSLS